MHDTYPTQAEIDDQSTLPGMPSMTQDEHRLYWVGKYEKRREQKFADIEEDLIAFAQLIAVKDLPGGEKVKIAPGAAGTSFDLANITDSVVWPILNSGEAEHEGLQMTALAVDSARQLYLAHTVFVYDILKGIEEEYPEPVFQAIELRKLSDRDAELIHDALKQLLTSAASN